MYLYGKSILFLKASDSIKNARYNRDEQSKGLFIDFCQIPIVVQEVWPR